MTAVYVRGILFTLIPYVNEKEHPLENEFDFTPGKPVAFRPTPYDVGVLESIHAAHPELKDVGDLIRKALREYQIAREGGGVKIKMGEVLALVERIPHIEMRVDFLVASVEKCESLRDHT